MGGNINPAFYQEVINNIHDSLNENFDNLPDRMWVSERFWAVPMEDWQIKNGRVESNGKRAEQRLNILTH